MCRQLVDYLNNGSIVINLWGKQVNIPPPSLLLTHFPLYSSTFPQVNKGGGETKEGVWGEPISHDAKNN